MTPFELPFYRIFHFIIILMILCYLVVNTLVVENVINTLRIPLDAVGVDVKYRNYQGEAHIREFFFQHRFLLCHDLAKRKKPSQQMMRVRYRLNCQDLYDHSGMGTGNWLAFLYGVRQVAWLLGQLELEMVCTDAVESQQTLILPWVMGTWGARPTPDLDWDWACRTDWDGTLLDDMRYELRRMAIALVGVPNESHPANSFIVDPAREEKLQLPMPSTPFWKNIELDDVAVHFRCGDILESTPHKKYGYARFHSLANFIDVSTVSIGIVTQPFHGGQARRRDKNKHGRCAILLGALQATLQQRFPQAVVSVRNSPNETITLAYARLIMAKQAIAAGTSTFVNMPFHATFGTAHRVAGEKLINSVRLYDMWNEENGKEQILNSLNSKDPV